MKLSPKLMKSIGTTIYQIDPSKLEEGILSKKKKAKPIGKKKQKKDDNEEDKEEEDNWTAVSRKIENLEIPNERPK